MLTHLIDLTKISQQNKKKLHFLKYEKAGEMTTAARPTFFPAMGGEDQGFYRMEGGTKQVSVRDLPGHTKLKLRKQVNFQNQLKEVSCAVRGRADRKFTNL